VLCAKVIKPTGLHVRAAAGLARIARALDAQVVLEHRGVTADARSVLSLMMLEAAMGDVVQIRATGPNAVQAAARVAGFFDSGFDDASL
jgi:phosphotransferase system HPr (HPr) family protein